MSIIETADNAPRACIFGLSGPVLTDEEKAFFEDANPLGFILFARNCQTPAQVRALTDSLRWCVRRNAPVLIDQEGGRVQRLVPPHWAQYPPMKDFGDNNGRDLLETIAGIAADLKACGISVNCAPVLDVLFPQTHAVLANRTFSGDPQTVTALGRMVCHAYMQAGIVPVIKHMPGLGRADLDTHHELPAVAAPRAALEAVDYKPFAALAALEVWGMVGHALYEALDPVTPASCSPIVIGEIRDRIAFDGLLLSDDISMGALGAEGKAAVRSGGAGGDLRVMGALSAGADEPRRAAAVLRAGCDIALHCNGKMADMKAVANAIEKMTGTAVVRYNRSVSAIHQG